MIIGRIERFLLSERSQSAMEKRREAAGGMPQSVPD